MSKKVCSVPKDLYEQEGLFNTKKHHIVYRIMNL